MKRYLVEFWPQDEVRGTSVKKPDGTMWIVEAEDEARAMTAAWRDPSAPSGCRIEGVHQLADEETTL